VRGIYKIDSYPRAIQLSVLIVSTYVFRCQSGAVEIPLTRAEGILYVTMCESPDWEIPVFGVHKKGQIHRRSRDDLVERADRLIAHLEPQAELLPFTYYLEQNVRSCLFNGKHAFLECGPGFCRICETEVIPSPKHPGASVVLSHQLADLRDLRPLLLDDGREIRATKRRGKHDLLSKVHQLKRFLDSNGDAWIECSAF
jgi:hypothetical protein